MKGNKMNLLSGFFAAFKVWFIGIETTEAELQRSTIKGAENRLWIVDAAISLAEDGRPAAMVAYIERHKDEHPSNRADESLEDILAEDISTLSQRYGERCRQRDELIALINRLKATLPPTQRHAAA